jgi:hypothetical protein
MEEPDDRKSPRDEFSRRIFLRTTGMGFSLMLGGMKVHSLSDSAGAESENSSAPAENSSVIKVHRSNLHYYQSQGRPMILINSAEQYETMINMDFD